jgi:hypothetical protein
MVSQPHRPPHSHTATVHALLRLAPSLLSLVLLAILTYQEYYGNHLIIQTAYRLTELDVQYALARLLVSKVRNTRISI